MQPSSGQASSPAAGSVDQTQQQGVSSQATASSTSTTDSSDQKSLSGGDLNVSAPTTSDQSVAQQQPAPQFTALVSDTGAQTEDAEAPVKKVDKAVGSYPPPADPGTSSGNGKTGRPTSQNVDKKASPPHQYTVTGTYFHVHTCFLHVCLHNYNHLWHKLIVSNFW